MCPFNSHSLGIWKVSDSDFMLFYSRNGYPQSNFTLPKKYEFTILNYQSEYCNLNQQYYYPKIYRISDCVGTCAGNGTK